MTIPQQNTPTLKAIPTNVITGFLGVGKSTAILHLLQQKPDNERWAVLVNEFGEVGIDGSLFTGRETEESGVFIREVAGGCMCCAAGLSMQIALNMLLARAKPDRLLIEPTGLGHPEEVLAVLAAEHYREILDLRATITLVDARKIQDERYFDHSTFVQQIAIADVIVANKADQYQTQDFSALLEYIEQRRSIGNTSVYKVSQGALQLKWLLAPAGQHDHSHHHHSQETPPSVLETPQIPEEGYLCIDNQGEGFYSRGWIFNPDWVFDERKLYTLLTGVNTERLKGVFITNQGITAYNKADNVLTERLLDDSLDSRIECISLTTSSLDYLEDALLDCVIAR